VESLSRNSRDDPDRKEHRFSKQLPDPARLSHARALLDHAGASRCCRNSACDIPGRESAIRLSRENSEASIRALLLSDIKAIFEKGHVNRIASAEICARLADLEEHPWPEWRSGQPITVRQLARLLEPLGIRPKQLRMGEVNARGYELDDFADGFSRYLPGISSATQLQPAPDAAGNCV
jgi:hypothetical protein